MFSNIEIPLGYNIMTLEYVLERIWKEIAKNIWKKFKFHHFRHFFWGEQPLFSLNCLPIISFCSKLSQFLKVSPKIALQPKLSENASWQIGSGSRKLWEIWPWFFYQLIDLVGGIESAHGFFIRRLDFSVDHFEVDTFRKFWLFKIPLHFL